MGWEHTVCSWRASNYSSSAGRLRGCVHWEEMYRTIMIWFVYSSLCLIYFQKPYFKNFREDGGVQEIEVLAV